MKQLLQTFSFGNPSELSYLLQLIAANESPEYNVSCYANSIKGLNKLVYVEQNLKSKLKV